MESYPFPDDFSPPGSSVYYALRFAPAQLRPALSLTYALVRTLQEIPRECSDPGVARMKLDWWRAELDRARNRQAQHPIARRMTELYREQGLDHRQFEDLFRGAEREISGPQPDNPEQFEHYCWLTGAPATRLLTLVAGGGERSHRTAEELGRFVRTVAVIRDLGLDVRRGRCWLPRGELVRRGLSPSGPDRETDPELLAGLLAELAAAGQRRYREALSGIPGRAEPALAPALCLAAIAERLLGEIAGEGFQVLRQRTSLTPLRKLWIAWRCHHRSRGP